MKLNFKYFRGFIPESDDPELNYFNTDSQDVYGLRQALESLIYWEMPASAAEIIRNLQTCAIQKREAFQNTGRWDHSEHVEFMNLLDHYQRIEDSHIADTVMFNYYKVHLVDNIHEDDHWILNGINDLKDFMWV